MSLNVEILFMWVLRTKLVHLVVLFLEFKASPENTERLTMKSFSFYFFHRSVVTRCLREKFIVLHNTV